MSTNRTNTDPFESMPLVLGAIIATTTFVCLMLIFPQVVLAPWKLVRLLGLQLIEPVSVGAYKTDVAWVIEWLRSTDASQMQWSQAMAVEARLWQTERWLLLPCFLVLFMLVAWRTLSGASGKPHTSQLTPEDLLHTHKHFSPRLRLFLRYDPLRSGDVRKGMFRVRTRVSAAAKAYKWMQNGRISISRVEAYLVKQLGKRSEGLNDLSTTQLRLLGMLALLKFRGRDAAVEVCDLCNAAEAEGGKYRFADAVLVATLTAGSRSFSSWRWVIRLRTYWYYLTTRSLLSLVETRVRDWLSDPEHGNYLQRHHYTTTLIHAILIDVGNDKGRIPAHEFAWVACNDWGLKTIIDDHLVARPSLDTLAIRSHYYMETAVGLGLERFATKRALAAVGEGLHRYGMIDAVSWRNGDIYAE